MTIADIASRTGLPVRKIRYVLDHKLVPYLHQDPQGRGQTRTFTEFEGFCAAAAAAMLTAGLPAKLVKACMVTMIGAKPSKARDSLWNIFHDKAMVGRGVDWPLGVCGVGLTFNFDFLKQEFKHGEGPSRP